jgi:hypothetical protein
LGHTDRKAVRTLIELSADPDADIRDWATFGLAQQIGTNTREVREALYARVEDEDDDTRAEALMGLARRRDERVSVPLIKELCLCARHLASPNRDVGRLSGGGPRQGFDISAEVLGGPALRTRMAEEVRAMAALYGDK